MTSIRQKYFEITKLDNKYLPKNVIYDLLCLTNNFSSTNELILHFDDQINNEELLDKYIRDICDVVPYQYVVNKSVFNGHTFYVDENVLIPRPETEELVIKTIEKINSLYNGQNPKIFDVCCGSGCIGISLKKALSNAEVYLSDISKEALEVTKRNAKELDADVTILEGDLLQPLIDRNIKVDVIISNPPYIKDKTTVDPQTLKHEPHLALFMNPPTNCYEKIFVQSQKVLNENGVLFFEIGEDMEESLTPLVFKYFPLKKGKFLKDIYNKTRFLIII